MNSIQLKVKVQAIYYQTPEDSLGITYATDDKRITMEESKIILLDRGIDFKEILKVKYEYIQLDIPMKELDSYII